MEGLNNTMNKLEPTKIENDTQQQQKTFFSSIHRACTKRDNILGHKKSLNKFKIL